MRKSFWRFLFWQSGVFVNFWRHGFPHQLFKSSPTGGICDLHKSIFRNSLHQFKKEGGAKFGVLGGLSTELQILIQIWPDLPDAGKVRIMAILLDELNGNMG